jgi:endonuclease III
MSYLSVAAVGRKRRQKISPGRHISQPKHTLCLNKEKDEIESEVVNVCIKRHSQFLNLLYIPLSQSFCITAPRCGGLLHVHYCHSFGNTP